MKLLRPPRTRAQLEALAAAIATTQFTRPCVVSVALQHDDNCAMLAGSAVCRCDVRLVFRQLRPARNGVAR